MSLQNIKDQKGFTIVELLIVIVVIGILAAITIVAFNGVQNRGKATRAQAVATDVKKKAEAFNADNSRYPVAVADFAGIAALSRGNAVTIVPADITTSNGETTVSYTACPASATATTVTGARIRYWDYGASPAALTPADGTGKTVTVGTC